MRYFEIHGLYWLVSRGWDLRVVTEEIETWKHVTALGVLKNQYFKRNSTNPELSLQNVIDFLLEVRNEEPRTASF